MLDVVVHGMWGVRKESPERLAERWVVLLRTLADIDIETCGTWREAAGKGAAVPAVTLTASAVAASLVRQNPEPDADYIGRTASLVAGGGARRPAVVVRVNAGGSANRVPDTCTVTFRSRRMDESVALVRRSSDVLAALGECWDIDWGEVYNDDQYDAVESEFGLRVTAPRCGRSVYLSARRAERAPEGLPGTYTRTEAGGLVIDLTRGGTVTPYNETIIEVNRKLRSARALEPLTAPFDRAAL